MTLLPNKKGDMEMTDTHGVRERAPHLWDPPPDPQIESPRDLPDAGASKGDTLGGCIDQTNTQPAEHNQEPESKQRICQRCYRPFTPRQGNGGKPQLYCSTACRKGNAVPNGNPNAVPNAKDAKDGGEDVGKDVGKDVEEDAAEFSWNNDDSVVLQQQRRTAVYFNTRDELVIRQEADWNEETDTVVIIAKNNIEEFLDKLTNVCGIPSFP
jgi:hypothetical protein